MITGTIQVNGVTIGEWKAIWLYGDLDGDSVYECEARIERRQWRGQINHHRPEGAARLIISILESLDYFGYVS